MWGGANLRHPPWQYCPMQGSAANRPAPSQAASSPTPCLTRLIRLIAHNCRAPSIAGRDVKGHVRKGGGQMSLQISTIRPCFWHRFAAMLANRDQGIIPLCKPPPNQCEYKLPMALSNSCYMQPLVVNCKPGPLPDPQKTTDVAVAGPPVARAFSSLR